MDKVSFSTTAFNHYLEWQSKDRKTVIKINALIQDIQRNGFLKGTGKPEPLKHRKGYSRRIDDFNRLIYCGDINQNLEIISCKGHYED